MKTHLIRVAGLAILTILAPAAVAATFTVTTTADSGAGSLRTAITQANLVNDPLNPVLIHFAVPPALLTPTGVAVIRPLTPLPVIQNAKGGGIRIDGYTQPGSSYIPFNPSSIVLKVELDGSLLPVPHVPPPQFAHGIHIMSSNNRVQGLCVHSFPHDGISIQGIPLGQTGSPSGSNFNEIFWNLVGADVTGMTAKPNGRDPGGLWGGIYVKVVPGSPGVANQNWILENVASGNAFEGVGIANCPPGDVQKNHVERCYVGIDITGTGWLGNGHQGIYIGEAAHHNLIEWNWVGANGYDGVGIVGYGPSGLSTHSNTLFRNRIGLDVNLNPMPNSWHGVAIGSYGGAVYGFAPDNLIEQNTIAHNQRAGVAVQEDLSQLGDNDSSRNKFTQNSIHDNGMIDPGSLGIDLTYEPGVTPNDPADPDQGANELVNFPVITSAIYSGGSTTVTGTLDTPALPAVIEIFKAAPDPTGYGEGAVYLGSSAPAGPNWSVAPPLWSSQPLPGQILTATATDAAGNTSEFALNVPVWDQDGQKFDYGDAPDPPYFTLAANGGPAHQIVPGMYLGMSVDGEPDGQPNATATGDDNDGNDDEDGVTFSGLVPGQLAQINVTASRGGWIDAWIDFDGNGTWHSTEQIVNGGHSGSGLTISYSFTVPAGALPGNTFARVRYSSSGNLQPFGPGPGGNPPDGEVEDEQVVIGQGQVQFDWGDAPDQPYPTLAASNGARHNASPNFCIGAKVDTETNGQPTPNADGDDLAGVPDDEDGVTWYAMNPGQASKVDVVVTGINGKIDAWVDFNADGDWLDPGEQIVISQPANTGLNTYTFNVPAAAIPGAITFTRVRLSTTGGLAPTGGPVPGEVEDDKVVIEEGPQDQFDWGDAPDAVGALGYQTMAANGGANHRIVTGVFLGAGVDGEPDGQLDPWGFAQGDDLNSSDDEDGVVFTSPIVVGQNVTLTVTASVAGFLDAWIDLNCNGTWNAGEQVLGMQPLVAGPNTLSFLVPAAATPGKSYARFRFHQGTASLPPGGPASEGEVEDSIVQIEQAADHKMHWAQYPDPFGWDVRGTQPLILADDFRCTETGKITRITFWGSWMGDEVETPDHHGIISNVHLSIHEDLRPAGSYSRPGVLKWQTDLPGAQLLIEPGGTGEEGWFDPSTGQWIRPDHLRYFKYTVIIPDAAAFEQIEGNIYWLDIQFTTVTQAFQWGWKTSLSAHFEDDGVWAISGPMLNWQELKNPLEPFESLDLAFVIGRHEQVDYDFGDAPDATNGTAPGDYETRQADNGAYHRIVTGGPYFDDPSGTDFPDPEPDGQPDLNAVGDDNDTIYPPANDDEDGIVFALPLKTGQNGSVTITVGGGAGGWVDAWIDFNGDGDWTDAGENIQSALMGVGPTVVNFLTPNNAVIGKTFARFRINGVGALPPTGGPASDGEVEDHAVDIVEEPVQFDFGDAPDPKFPTLLASNGARHPMIVGGPVLGNVIDPEGDGQPTANADGDDLNPPLIIDDEDGITFPTAVIIGVPMAIQVSTVSGGVLQGWVDWNADGDWADPSEQIITNQVLAAGTTTLNIPVPTWAAGGTTYARFRISSQQNLPFNGPAPDGEVEDYRIDLEPLKWLQIPEQGKEGVDVSNKDFTLADDFQCTASGPITDIHFWGSFIDDILPPEGPGGLIFDVSIWSDVPKGVNAQYSHPGQVLWSMTFSPGQYNACKIWWVKEGEWWHNPGTQFWRPNADKNIYQFDFYPPPGNAFVQTEGTIYWLSVKYRYQGPGSFQFGWKTTPNAWNDDACYQNPTSPVGWTDLFYQLPHPWAPDSLNLAFALSGEEQAAKDWGDAPDDLTNPNDYPTLSANNGASHIIATDPTGIVYQLGPMIDAEADGQPTLPADGDDLNPPLGLDDEDGVVFASPWIPGVATLFQVQASTAGFLNLWVDLNRDNDWADANERIFADKPLVPGINSITLVVPASATAGPTYARFRFTSQALVPLGIDFSGPAPDGEVEDYQVKIEEQTGVDWGDAPDPSYPTMISNNGARHLIVPGYCLGSAIDSEPDGQPTPNANGDDLTGVPDDEDGIFFFPLIAGQMSAFNVKVTGPAGSSGFIDAWIDFNGNGSWLDAGEQISAPVVVGLKQIMFPVPAGAVTGPTYARIRFSSGGGLAPTGQANDGEVEDYLVQIRPQGELAYDFGDARDPTYPTLSASNGARHLVGGPLWFGAKVDAELDGQPTPLADGDDLNPPFPGPDDEDGITFPYPLILGLPNVVQVTASAPGRVDAWIDADRNGVWSPAERILTSVAVAAGSNTLPINIPLAFVAGGSTVTRFRISSAGGLPPTGFAREGEVEDHLVSVYGDDALRIDWGDAPDPFYPTLVWNLGAAHLADTLFLGSFFDWETNGQPAMLANGDDIAGIPDDEDGVSFTTLVSGCSASVIVVASGAGLLDAWMDLDRDGTWNQAGDFIIPGLPVVPGPKVFPLTVPAGIGPAFTYARFRVSHASLGVGGFTGYTVGGEVEDYRVAIGKRIHATISLTTPPPVVVLNWSVEPGATNYSVYSSTTLAGPFPAAWTLEASGLAGTTWSQTVAGPRKFFVVVAFP